MEPERNQTDLLAVLLDMRNGRVAKDCNDKFNQVLSGVLDTGGKGELTIKLFLEPEKMGIGGSVIEVKTSHECKMKIPEISVGSARFFVTERGTLTRNDPDQQDLELADVTEGAREQR